MEYFLPNVRGSLSVAQQIPKANKIINGVAINILTLCSTQ